MKPSIKWIKENIKGVIFDLDGTLIDSMWMWKEIDREYLSGYGISLPEDYQKCIEGMSFHEVAVYTKERFGIPDTLDGIKDTWNRMSEEFYRTRVPEKPGVLAFLRFLKKQGIRCGIATSNSRKLSESVLRARGLDGFFDVHLTGCEVAHGKPYPDIYLEVAGRLMLSPGQCLVFEDVEAGIAAGKAAGMKVCAVYDAYSLASPELLKTMADYYIDSFEDFVYEEG